MASQRGRSWRASKMGARRSASGKEETRPRNGRGVVDGGRDLRGVRVLSGVSQDASRRVPSRYVIIFAEMSPARLAFPSLVD